MSSAGDELAPFKRALGDLLAARRATAGLTQRQLAQAVSYGRTTVATAESGHRQPAAEFWVGCDKILGAGGDLTQAYEQLAAARRRRAEQRLRTERSLRRPSVEANLPAVRNGTPQRAVGSAQDGSNDASVTRYPVSGGPAETAFLNSIRTAMTTYTANGAAPLDPRTTLRPAVKAHRLYQRADYSAAAELLSPLLVGLEVGSSSAARSAHVAAAAAYLAASKLAVKAGDAQLAWVAADRAATHALHAGDYDLHAAAAYQVACALFADSRVQEAERLAVQVADGLGRFGDSPRTLSVRGSLLLLAAVTAARRSAPADSAGYLIAAERLAHRLGKDGNQLWTGFGPTNVAIHRLSAAVALSRPDQALVLGAAIDTSALPAGLAGRRSQVHLDLARARAEQHDDPVAVLHLLEAERIASQTINTNTEAQRTVAALLHRERRDLTPGLRPLALRAGLAA